MKKVNVSFIVSDSFKAGDCDKCPLVYIDDMNICYCQVGVKKENCPIKEEFEFFQEVLDYYNFINGVW